MSVNLPTTRGLSAGGSAAEPPPTWVAWPVAKLIVSRFGLTELLPYSWPELEKAALESVRYPADGKWLGDWKQGEAVAQRGVGLQWSDSPTTVNGGNCYACHRITIEEISYGTIGPSLYEYGKLRGTSEQTLRYTWGKIWNAHAYSACSSMPRFGDAGILTEGQIRDLMALLLDPKSPVNR